MMNINANEAQNKATTLNDAEMKVLNILYANARMPHAQIAVMAGLGEEETEAIISKLEEKRVIVGYQVLVNWDNTPRERVEGLIEVKVAPQHDMGFDAVAERISRYEEVRAVYLMSGAYDLLLEVEAATLRQLSAFVFNKLATLDNVMSTATHFVLKKYKVDGVVMDAKPQNGRLAVSL